MKLLIKKRFFSDYKKIKDQKTKDEIEYIFDLIEKAESTKEIYQFKKLKGWKNYGRIRVNEFRIGVEFYADTVIVVSVNHMSIAYKYFP